MPRITVEPDPAPSPKPRKRTNVSRETVRRAPPGVPFPYPAEAVAWTLRNEAGEKLGHFTDEGAEVKTFPIGDFLLDTIRERWGAGAYRVFFTGKDGKPRGNREFRIADAAPARSGGGGGERPSPVPSALVAADPWARAMELFSVVKQASTAEANTAIERDRAFLAGAQANAATMFQAAMGHARERDAAAQQALPAQLGELFTRLEARLTAIEEDLAGDPDDPDPDDPEPMTQDASGMPAFPETWDGLGQFLYRVIVRQMPAIEKAAPEILKKLQDAVNEAASRQRAQAIANGAQVVGP